MVYWYLISSTTSTSGRHKVFVVFVSSVKKRFGRTMRVEVKPDDTRPLSRVQRRRAEALPPVAHVTGYLFKLNVIRNAVL